MKNNSQSMVLARVDKARLALIEARDAISAKRVADMAKAAEVFAIKQKCDEAKTYAHEIYVEALRLEGDYLRQEEKNKGGRPKKTNDIVPSVSAKTLKEQGIQPRESVLAQAVSRAAEECPKLFEEVKSGGKVNDIRRHYKKKAHEAKVKECATKPIDISTGPYDIIMSDPPWRYDFEEAKNREVENQYQTATIAEICGHKPNSSKDSILLLWATAPKLEEALQVMKAWGFTYRTCAVWDKQVIGMGYWFRVQHELLLLGVKGKPGSTPESERISSVFIEKRRQHSQKPEAVYEWVEKAFPGLKKAEMYARQPRPGWARIQSNEC